MKKLALVFVFCCLLLASCQPAIEAIASPANAPLVTNGNAVTPGDALVSPSNYTSPSDYVSPSNAEMLPAGVDTSLYPVLTQETLDKLMTTFFAGSDARYFSYDHSVENGPHYWIDKPVLTQDSDSLGTYETMDAKAYSGGVVYDMWAYHKVSYVGFNLSITGRNLMTQEEAEALRLSDGIAWMSMQQGLIGSDDIVTLENEAEKAITREAAIEKANALMSAIGLNAPAPTTVLPSYRIRMSDPAFEGEADAALREYGWVITFHPLHYETVEIGVTASGYGQFFWAVEF